MASPQIDVALISMPFGPLFYPSLGLALLKAGSAKRKLLAKDFYFAFQLAERIGTHQYLTISNGAHSTFDLLGEWIFSRSLFGADSVRESAYIEQVLKGGSPAHRKDDEWYGANPEALTPETIELLLSLRDQDEFLDQCADEVLACNPAMIGFTSVFQQQLASLALAKRLKQRVPGLPVIMGGANCESPMGEEILKRFPFVDIVVSGEADLIFADLVEAVLKREPVSHLAGVHSRRAAGSLHVMGSASNAPSVMEMDSLPVPDYTGYFEQFEVSRFRLSDVYKPHILFETSRGCYWGKVSHCTFCGLNGSTMTFRSKSPDRAIEELTGLTSAYPGSPVTVVDNILDMRYFQTFIPDLGARKLDLQLFYEVKSNLKKSQVRLLRDAGIRGIQPGIESLSTPILQQMKKGCTRLQNVQLLKWCKEYGVKAVWNLLWGFPEESPEEYESMADLVPSLFHLDGPQVGIRLRLDRFSPYFNRPEESGFRNARPYPSYSYVYHLEPEALANLAYYYSSEYAQPRDVSSYTRGMRQAIDQWRERRPISDLFSADLGPCLAIWDLREGAREPLHVLDGLARGLYLACDAIQGMPSLQRAVAQDPGLMSGGENANSQGRIEDALAPLVENNLMLREGNSYLSLGVALGDYRPSDAIRSRFIEQVRRMGRRSGDEWAIENPLGTLQLGCDAARQTPDRRSIGPAHFRLRRDGAVLVNLDAIERIDLDRVARQLSGMPA